MAEKEKLKSEIHKVFHSNLIYIITGSGFFLIFLVGFILNFTALKLVVVSILGSVFFYIFSILILSELLASSSDSDTTEPARYDRSVYKYNLLYWKLKSKLSHEDIQKFKERTEVDFEDMKKD